MTEVDLVVVGAGPGGYVAAIRAAQLGISVAVVEREHLGGICLNWGCIPTKALLRSAEVYEQLSYLTALGLSCSGKSFDFAKVIDRSREVARKLNAGIAHLMKKHSIRVIEGGATLEAGAVAPKVAVRLRAGGSVSLAPRNVILATGARPRAVPAVGMAPNGKTIWTYREALSARWLPESMIVIGSGAIGLEFASFYASFGCEVTVLEAVGRILPAEDAEVSALAQKALERRGIRFEVGARVTRVESGQKSARVEIVAQGQLHVREAAVVLLALGIEANIENIGLEALGVKMDRGHVVTNEFGATNVAHLFAVGDIAGAPWLAHKASHEAVRCVEHIAGMSATHAVSPIPSCTYTSPQVASVGLTEAVARERGHDVRVGRFPLSANGKAIALGEPVGFVKTVFGSSGQLLGAHMIGPEVTEMIQGYALAMTLESTEAEIMATVFPHPTVSESMHESVLAAFDRALHI